MLEKGTSGLMSGEGKRAAASRPRTALFLDSTRRCLTIANRRATNRGASTGSTLCAEALTPHAVKRTLRFLPVGRAPESLRFPPCEPPSAGRKAGSRCVAFRHRAAKEIVRPGRRWLGRGVSWAPGGVGGGGGRGARGGAGGWGEARAGGRAGPAGCRRGLCRRALPVGVLALGS